MRAIRLAVAVGAAALALATVVTPAAAAEGGKPFDLVLLGANEVPGPGDPDGSGTATLRINPGLEQVCYEFEVTNVDPVVGAHIHYGSVTEQGPIRVHTPATDADSGAGCVHADRALLLDIIRNPELYYFNVHSVAFRPGAVRAQLA